MIGIFVMKELIKGNRVEQLIIMLKAVSRVRNYFAFANLIIDDLIFPNLKQKQTRLTHFYQVI